MALRGTCYPSLRFLSLGLNFFFYLISIRITLPATPLKLNHSLLPGFFASKKYRKTSTEGVWPRWLHKMPKALTKNQLLGCSWVGATLTSASNACSNPVSGRRSLTCLKTIEYMKKKGAPAGFVWSSVHTSSPFLQGRTDTYTSCSLPKTWHFSSASPSFYVMTSWLEVYLEVSAKRSLGAQS